MICLQYVTISKSQNNGMNILTRELQEETVVQDFIMGDGVPSLSRVVSTIYFSQTGFTRVIYQP